MGLMGIDIILGFLYCCTAGGPGTYLQGLVVVEALSEQADGVDGHLGHRRCKRAQRQPGRQQRHSINAAAL